jgi:hypothetical protein
MPDIEAIAQRRISEVRFSDAFDADDNIEHGLSHNRPVHGRVTGPVPGRGPETVIGRVTGPYTSA